MVDRNDQLDADQDAFEDPGHDAVEPLESLGVRAVQAVVEINGVPYAGTEKPSRVERYMVCDPLTHGL